MLHVIHDQTTHGWRCQMTRDDPKGVVVILNIVSVEADHNMLALCKGIYPSGQNTEFTLFTRFIFLV